MKYQIVDVSGSEYDVYDTQEEASRELLEYRLAYASNHGGDEEAHMEAHETYFMICVAEDILDYTAINVYGEVMDI